MNKRYELIEGSESGHCCFSYTIIDTDVVDFVTQEGITYYETVCECFEESYAKLILEALNEGHK